mmetsp:Transcript_9691/g.17052  ORF Transcript_9691/g.17052 Transcript_9691/m.17052 type:complete len:376 (-) Transcript_9691:218-1345(-)
MENESWTSVNFDATLLCGELHVGLIPEHAVHSHTHILLDLLVRDAEREQSEAADSQGQAGAIRASNCEVNLVMVHELGGVTVIVNDAYREKIMATEEHDIMEWAPTPWRAIQIHLGPAGAEAPGIVSYLSCILNERNVSILNFATCETDLILVQVRDVDKIREVLAECGSHGVSGLKQLIATKIETPSPKNALLKPSGESITEANLSVMKSRLVLGSLDRHMLRQCMFPLVKQLTRNVKVGLRLMADTQAGSQQNNELTKDELEADFMWAYISTQDEISLLFDEKDIKYFPEDSLVVSPERWTAIRLVSRSINFDETGIVRIMSSPYEAGVSLLNMSAYSTNFALVLPQDEQTALDYLRSELNGETTRVFKGGPA